MNIVKLMVIIIYLIIGSALGIIIIPEIANDLGLQNSSFLKNHYVDGIIGSIFMFLIFGVFIRRVTNAIKVAMFICLAIFIKLCVLSRTCETEPGAELISG